MALCPCVHHGAPSLNHRAAFLQYRTLASLPHPTSTDARRPLAGEQAEHAVARRSVLRMRALHRRAHCDEASRARAADRRPRLMIGPNGLVAIKIANPTFRSWTYAEGAPSSRERQAAVAIDAHGEQSQVAACLPRAQSRLRCRKSANSRRPPPTGQNVHRRSLQHDAISAHLSAVASVWRTGWLRFAEQELHRGGRTVNTVVVRTDHDPACPRTPRHVVGPRVIDGPPPRRPCFSRKRLRPCRPAQPRRIRTATRVSGRPANLVAPVLDVAIRLSADDIVGAMRRPRRCRRAW